MQEWYIILFILLVCSVLYFPLENVKHGDMLFVDVMFVPVSPVIKLPLRKKKEKARDLDDELWLIL